MKNSRTPRPSPRSTAHRASSSGDHASPPTTTTRKSGKPSGSTDANAAGVTKACDTRSDTNNFHNSTPPNTDASATTIVDDAPTANSNSNTDASKLGEAKCSVRESAANP